MWKILSSEQGQEWVGGTVRRQKKQVKEVWQGKDYPNFGLERLLMLFLAVYPFVTIGLYLRNIYHDGKYDISRKLLTDGYVLFNMLFPIVILFSGLYAYSFVVWICLYLCSETLVALLSMLFLKIPSPASYRRNVLCLCFNFIQFVAFYAVLYMTWGGDFRISIGECTKIVSPLQAFYFSLETLTTVGFGDVSPVNNSGYIVLFSQMLTSLMFICLFFSVFVSQIGKETYKSKKKEQD